MLLRLSPPSADPVFVACAVPRLRVRPSCAFASSSDHFRQHTDLEQTSRRATSCVCLRPPLLPAFLLTLLQLHSSYYAVPCQQRTSRRRLDPSRLAGKRTDLFLCSSRSLPSTSLPRLSSTWQCERGLCALTAGGPAQGFPAFGEHHEVLLAPVHSFWPLSRPRIPFYYSRPNLHSVLQLPSHHIVRPDRIPPESEGRRVFLF